MNVISFPGARMSQGHAPDPAFYLISALRQLGEPATLGELSAIIRQLPGWRTDWTDALLGSVLEKLSRTGLDDLPETPVFRLAPLRSGEAWAFTQTFRNLLRSHDMPAALRPVPLTTFRQADNS